MPHPANLSHITLTLLPPYTLYTLECHGLHQNCSRTSTRTQDLGALPLATLEHVSGFLQNSIKFGTLVGDYNK